MATSNSAQMAKMEILMKEARSVGAIFHPTNPADCFYCDCGVFGRGTTSCWNCGSEHLHWQFSPKMGGGAETVVHEPDELGLRSADPQLSSSSSTRSEDNNPSIIRREQ